MRWMLAVLSDGVRSLSCGYNNNSSFFLYYYYYRKDDRRQTDPDIFIIGLIII